MMLALFIKDVKLMLRDRKSLLVTMLMPIVLIAILGFSLKGVMDTDDLPFNAVVGIVSEQSEAEAWQQFESDLVKKLIPEPLKQAFIANGREVQPERMLIEQVFQTEKLRENIEVIQFNNIAEAEQSLEADELTALIIFPEQFSYHLWELMFFNEGKKEELSIIMNKNQQLAAETVVQIVNGFYDRMTFSYEVGKQIVNRAIMMGGMEADPALFQPLQQPFGEIVSVSENGTLSSFKYYTLGMAIMFVLFSASYGAIQAFEEKTSHIYARLIVSDVSLSKFIFSKWLAVSCFALLQLSVLMGLSFLLYDVKWENFGGILVIGMLLSMAVGSIAVLLSAINYRLNQINAAMVFMSGGVAILALLGGSFNPIENLPDIVKVIGEYTMTGASMQGFLLLEQGFSLGDIQQVFFTIFVNALILYVVAIGIWPKEVQR